MQQKKKKTYTSIQPFRSIPPTILPTTLRHNSSNLTRLLRKASIAMPDIDYAAVTVQQAIPRATETCDQRSQRALVTELASFFPRYGAIYRRGILSSSSEDLLRHWLCEPSPSGGNEVETQPLHAFVLRFPQRGIQGQIMLYWNRMGKKRDSSSSRTRTMVDMMYVPSRAVKSRDELTYAQRRYCPETRHDDTTHGMLG